MFRPWRPFRPRPVIVRPVLVPRPRFYRRRIGCLPVWGVLLFLVLAIAVGASLFVLLR